MIVYYGLTSTQCFGESYSPVAKFQKSYSLGYTDPKQRWDDLVSCGVKLGDVTLHSAWRKALEPLNKELLEKLSAKFRACMKNKGYITIDSCGRKIQQQIKVCVMNRTMGNTRCFYAF